MGHRVRRADYPATATPGEANTGHAWKPREGKRPSWPPSSNQKPPLVCQPCNRRRLRSRPSRLGEPAQLGPRPPKPRLPDGSLCSDCRIVTNTTIVPTQAAPFRRGLSRGKDGRKSPRRVARRSGYDSECLSSSRSLPPSLIRLPRPRGLEPRTVPGTHGRDAGSLRREVHCDAQQIFLRPSCRPHTRGTTGGLAAPGWATSRRGESKARQVPDHPRISQQPSVCLHVHLRLGRHSRPPGNN